MIYTIKIGKKRSLSNKKKTINTERIQIYDIATDIAKTELEQRKTSYYIKLLFIALGIVSLCTIVICLIVFFTMKKKVNSEGIPNESNFVINTNVKSLSQFLMKSYQKHNSVSNVINSSFSVFTQAKYDIYTLNESNPEQNTSLYTKKYKTIIIINSQCISFEENNKNCELDKYLDLTIKNKTNISITNENIEEIKKAILPICIIEHTDNNIIFTITCPENLSENLKNNIISAFQSIKPISSKENYNNYNLAGYTINAINNHKEINIFDKRCDYDNDNYNCETITNLTTDYMGNLEKINKISKFEMNKDDKNKYYNNFNYSFENITTHKDDNNNEDNFKYNLNIILELIKPLMKKEDLITINMLNNLTNNISNFHFSKRKLEDDENTGYIDVKEESFFNQQLFGVNLGINLKNDFGLGNLENAKVISELIRGEDTKLLLNEQIITNINKTLTEFIMLSKAGNKLAYSLYQQLNESFTSLKNIINSNITYLNNLLSFTDLSSVFDSTLAINNLKEVPTDIISVSLNLYRNKNIVKISME